MFSFVGDQLRQARLANGLSLDELGQRVEVTRQYIHQLEIGAKAPSQEMVLALAELLGVKPAFFQTAPSSTVRIEQCHFRKQQTTPLSVTSQVLARGTLIEVLIAELDKRLKLPQIDFPDIPVSNEEDIERAAEQCRRHWGLGIAGPIVNMTRVVENAGAVVTYFAGISERVDALSIDARRPLIVRSSAKESLCRLRFDLAHECGHLVMHRGVHTGDQLTEAQANRFASAFLLPRSAFVREFPRGRYLDWQAIYDLKLRWKVAARAIARRAYDLSLITATQYRSANIHLVKTGQAKVERYDKDLPLENAELLDTALSTLESACPGSLKDLLHEVGFEEGIFKLLTGRNIPTSDHQQSASNVIKFQ